ncbi:hypothetical protein [Protaetiibacter larvae]|uniref:Helix-turn-helix domain-containing protein n=1 Tax=Protaetiibacter larvae TaxID=2592654 RepID=A0A5C1Y9H7_9MICO|nr:hypothetical protein [Protaetiibacter larvae]QEO09557.1 hypothetical protein FLP23_05760 [Protaetiibacter larvae]
MNPRAIDPDDPIADDLAAVVALRALADQLEDSAVERALRAGWGWGQIAEGLGVTRQAVHKKHLQRVASIDLELRRRRNV